jgi:hypothetical protein
MPLVPGQEPGGQGDGLVVAADQRPSGNAASQDLVVEGPEHHRFGGRAPWQTVAMKYASCSPRWT